MKKNSGSFRNSGAYTSPGTPEHGENDVGQTNRRRHISVTALMPFNSGRTLPSKWDDAERWITSPISSYGASKNSFDPPQSQQKSKSGPLAPPGHGNGSNFMANSRLSTGVLVPNGLSIHYDNGIDAKSNSLYIENDIVRSTSMPDSLSESSVPSSQDDKLDGTKEEEVVSRVVSRRDMATQMSLNESTRSSSKGRLSFSSLLFSRPNSVRLLSNPADKDEIRDVQVDKGTSTANEPNKQGLKMIKTKKKDSKNVEDLPSSCNDSEASNNTSKLQREEAKITAWENLHKAKAEAAIQKLEMKLEKERSKSMDKILNKLRAAETKAQAMRDLLSENHAHQASRTSHRRISCCIYFKTYSLSNSFLCHRN
ncbi:hypothetical protein ACJIZ3_008074 [Penstemon smallii]|uniref:Remorin C-terminal domain-containing protein n=1 Tax=Penstemon smallii TaxID=265156 RepID=A0ABD3TA82_9LAMI